VPGILDFDKSEICPERLKLGHDFLSLSDGGDLITIAVDNHEAQRFCPIEQVQDVLAVDARQRGELGDIRYA
jgi:hypothetical protein